MERWTRFAGILGLVLFGFGIIGGLSVGSFTEPLLFAHIVAGILLILYWFVIVGLRNFGEAGTVIRGRTSRFSANVILYSVVFLGIIGIVNFLASKHDRKLDLTEEGVYSLSPQSRSLVKNLTGPLKIVGFKGAENLEKLKDLLDMYRGENAEKVTTDLIDPRSKPHLLETYGMNQGNLLYLEFGEGAQKAVSRINEVSEDSITNAIIKLTRGASKKIYYIEGHGEPDLQSTAEEGAKLINDAVTDEHLAIESLILSEKKEIPADAAAILLVAPKKVLLPQEKDLLIKYGESGGRLVLLTDPQGSQDIKDIAEKFGMQVHDDVVIDQVIGIFGPSGFGALPIVKDYGTHPITKTFTQRSLTVFAIASSISTSAHAPTEGVTYTDLLKSSPSAWGETDLKKVLDTNDPVAEKDSNDYSGPLSLGMVYEKKLSPPDPKQAAASDVKFATSSRVVLIGDSDWALNGNIRNYFNRDLLLNILNWSVGEEGGISIRSKTMRTSMAPIERESFMKILASSLLIPELIIVAGLLVWWRRRQVAV